MMHLVNDLGLKMFNINAHELRGKEFYKSIVDYRKNIMPMHRGRIKHDMGFNCTLCKSTQGEKFLEWEEGYTLFECQSCGAVSPNIEFKNEGEHISSIYDVDEYKKKFMRETHNQFEYRKNNFGSERFEYTVNRLGLDGAANVLDVGCGAGYFISVLDDKGLKYKGLEIGEHFVEYCRTYHNLNVENSSLEDEPDHSYDLITMFDVLEHLVDPIAVFGSVHNKLRNGGYCIAYTPNIHSISYELMGGKQNTLLPFEHLCFFNKKSIDYLAEKTGFTVESVELYGLDVMDYLLMKEYEDKFDYTVKLAEFMKLMQAVLDKYEISNHFRITLKKV